MQFEFVLKQFILEKYLLEKIFNIYYSPLSNPAPQFWSKRKHPLIAHRGQLKS